MPGLRRAATRALCPELAAIQSLLEDGLIEVRIDAQGEARLYPAKQSATQIASPSSTCCAAVEDAATLSR